MSTCDKTLLDLAPVITNYHFFNSRTVLSFLNLFFSLFLIFEMTGRSIDFQRVADYFSIN